MKKKKLDRSKLMKDLWKSGKIVSPKKKIRICSVCGKEFVRKDVRNHRKTCSDKCAKYTKDNCWKINPHPRGMLGKKHSKKVSKSLGERSKKMWADKNHKVNSKEFREMMSDNSLNNVKNGLVFNDKTYSRSKRGWYKKGKKKYYMRSGWELNYACYLDFLIKQKEIKRWEYEPDTFWFDKIRRGVRSYLPDFKVFNNNGSIEYHEVKGWMDAKSKTKLKRMAKYYPEVKMILIDEKPYKAIMKYKKLYGANY